MGPGLIFAGRLLQLSAAARVGLVPCAAGGSCIDDWQPGSPLYQQMASLLFRFLHSMSPGRMALLFTLRGPEAPGPVAPVSDGVHEHLYRGRPLQVDRTQKAVRSLPRSKLRCLLWYQVRFKHRALCACLKALRLAGWFGRKQG